MYLITVLCCSYPRHACAARVTVLGLCVCVCVCLHVCLSVSSNLTSRAITHPTKHDMGSKIKRRLVRVRVLLNVHLENIMMTFLTSFQAEKKPAYKGGVLGRAKLKFFTLCRASLFMAFSATREVHSP